MRFIRVNYMRDFVSGRVFRGMLLMVLPLIGIAVMNYISSVIITALPAYFFGADALSGISVANSTAGMLGYVVTGLGAAAAVVGAHAFGSRDERRLAGTVHMTMLIAFVAGIALTVAGMFVVSIQRLEAQSVPEEIIYIALLYGRANAFRYFGMTIFAASLGLMYSVGDAVRPLLLTLIHLILDVTLNLLAIIVLNMGVTGMGIASSLSAFISAALAFGVLCISKGPIRFRFSRLFRFEWKELLFVFVVVLTVFLQSFIVMKGAAQQTVQSYINTYGVYCVAGYNVAYNVAAPASVLGSALLPVIYVSVGQASGAMRSSRAIKNSLMALATVVVPSVVAAIALMLLVFPIACRITTDWEIIDIAMKFARPMIVADLLLSVAYAVAAVVRARGFSLTACLLSGGVIALSAGNAVTKLLYGMDLGLRTITDAGGYMITPAVIAVFVCLAGAAAVAAAMHFVYAHIRAKRKTAK